MAQRHEYFDCPSCGELVTVPNEPNNPDVGDYSVTVECQVCQDVWTVDEGNVWDDNGDIVAKCKYGK